MSTEQFMSEPPKNRAVAILTYVGVAAVAFGAGMLLESHLAAQTAATVKLAHEEEVKQAEKKVQDEKRMAEEQKQALTESLAKEHEENEKAIKAKDRSLAAVSSRATGVQHSLEADLSAARTSGEACTSRITRISEALGGVFDSVTEVTGLAQDLGRENEQLKADNKSLADKLAGWQKWNAERNQRVTVTGQKNG